jgi:hypothetical protein
MECSHQEQGRSLGTPIGYIPNLYLLSKNENKFRMNSLEKLRMYYHEIMDAMLASVVKLQAKVVFRFLSPTVESTMM